MKLNLNPWVRFAIAGAIFLFYILTMVAFNWYDGLIRAFAPAMYLLAAFYGIAGAAVTYGVLPTKKAIVETFNQWQHGTPSGRGKAVGYWKWLAVWVIIFVTWVPIYISEL